MGGEPYAPDDYHWARQVAALLLIGVIVVIVLLDAVVDDYEARASVLVPLLLTVAGLLSVDLPRLRPWCVLKVGPVLWVRVPPG